MKRSETVNTFNEGLIMDLNPIVTPNNVVSNALNATLVTMNGNENALQNDMGNGRVETAYLPEGYIPLGTAQLGGIIYIVSYNPLIDKCQIGSFPSPERNITTDEFSTIEREVSNADFVKDGDIINTVVRLELMDKPLSPGDKYIIYSDKISDNGETLSDYAINNNTIIGDNPKAVTIHVVSIEDDGKIVYLDDTLKWYGGYYIKQLSNLTQNESNADIDKYRTLVSTTYNTFRSKVSGKLALLFQLEVIDTFSVSWDAQTNSSSLKSATIYFYINYTSRHPDINPAFIYIDDSDNYYKKELSIPEGRTNNGEDESIQVEIGNVGYTDDSNSVITYHVVPAMSFGKMKWLQQDITINLSELGSGRIELDEWRYYKQENNIILNWGLLAYPEKNKKIEGVVFTFIPFDNIPKNLSDNQDLSESQFVTIDFIRQGSYSGNFQEVIDLAENQNSTTLYNNYLYLVQIKVKYTGKDIYYYRWMYTTGQWNDKYIEDTVQDFNELYLDDVLKLQLNETVSDSIKAVEYQPEVKLPESFMENDIYQLMKAQVTSVNYSRDENKFTNQSNIGGIVSTTFENYCELFNYSKQDNDLYSFEQPGHEIILGEISTGLSTTLQGNAVPKVSNNEMDLSQMASTLSNILSDQKMDQAIDSQALDSFKLEIQSNTSGQFDIAVNGVMFSRVVADLKNVSTNPQQEIRPIIYKVSDFRSHGMSTTGASSILNIVFDSSCNIHIQNPKSGQVVFLHKFIGEEEKSAHYDNEQLTTTWQDLSPYKEWFPEWMKSYENAFFSQIRMDGFGDANNGEDTTFGLSSIKGRWAVFVKTHEEGRFIPIQAFSDSQYAPYTGDDGMLNANRVGRILMSLFTVHEGSDYQIQVIRVDQIFYIPNYKETLNITIPAKISVASMNISTQLLGKEATLSLQDLQGKLGSDISDSILNNISFKYTKMEYGKEIKMSHEFNIYNTLNSKFENLTSSTVNQIIRIPGQEKDTIIEVTSIRYNSDEAYVWNQRVEENCLISTKDKSYYPYMYWMGSIHKRADDVVYLGVNKNPFTVNNPLFNYLEVKNGKCAFNYQDILRESQTISMYTARKNREYVKLTNCSTLKLIGI